MTILPTWAGTATFLLLTVLCIQISAVQHADRGIHEDALKLRQIDKRASLAPARGAALSVSTTTVPLASGRGRATQTTKATTVASTGTLSKSSTSSRTTSITSKPVSTKTTSTSVKSTSTTPSSKITSSSKTSSKTTSKVKTSTVTSTKPTTKTSTTMSPIATTSVKPFYSKKKGISYNDASYTFLLNGSISWTYNWYSAPRSNLPASVEFAPMLWSNASDLTSVWTNNVKAEKARGGSHLLAFNEPDLGEQANMTVNASVTAYKQYMQPFRKDFKLVSPAVTNGGSPMGVAYLQEFLANCTGCQVDAVALHWYDAAWNTGYFFNYMNDAIKAFSPLPIWLTEFRGSGTPDEQIKFINTVVPWMEKQPAIERYALFGLFEGAAADGNMVTNGTLNEVGRAYAAAGGSL